MYNRKKYPALQGDPYEHLARYRPQKNYAHKALEDKEAVAKEVNDRASAIEVIASALENYINKFCK